MNGPLNQTIDLELGFGGVGHSGMGRIGGYESFKQFSNRKACVIRRPLNFWPVTALCPPYTSSKKRVIRTLLSLLFIKKNSVLKFIKNLVIFVVIYQLTLGKWGKSQFRKELVEGLIEWLKKKYVN